MPFKKILTYKREIVCALILGIIAAAAGICHCRMSPDISNDGVSYLKTFEMEQENPEADSSVPPLYLDIVRKTAETCSADYLSTGIFLNTFFYILTSVICFITVRIITGRIEPGVWSSALLIVQPYFLSFSHDFLRESLYLFTVSVFLLAFVYGLRFSSMWSWAIAGAFSVLAFFTRYEGAELIVFVLMGLCILFAIYKQPPRRIAISFLMYLIGGVSMLILLAACNTSFDFILNLYTHMGTHLRT